MILCDLCGQAKECTPRQIEGKEYDICADCWNPLAEKLKGKGRGKKQRETVFLPPLKQEPESPPTEPGPGEPPKIWGDVGFVALAISIVPSHHGCSAASPGNSFTLLREQPFCLPRPCEEGGLPWRFLLSRDMIAPQG